METEATIRAAGPGDINTIGALARQVWPLTYGAILSNAQLEYMLQLIYSQESLKKQMLQQGHQFLLALVDDEPVGFASFSETLQQGTYKLHKLYVRTDIQGKGLGKALINAVTAAIEPLHATSLLLNVNRQNKAITFYEKSGFTIIKEEDIDIGQGYFMNDYVMEKVIG